MRAAKKGVVSREKHIEGLLQHEGNDARGFYYFHSRFDDNDFSQHYKCVW